MAGRVEGKVAIVVGAGQTPGATIGNGRATAILLAREGASVAVADRDLASAGETVAMIAEEGGAASAFEADATSEASLAEAGRGGRSRATAGSTSSTTTWGRAWGRATPRRWR